MSREALSISLNNTAPGASSEFSALKSRITIAIRGERKDEYDKIRSEIIIMEGEGDISRKEAVRLLDHLEALATKDEELRLKTLLATDPEFLRTDPDWDSKARMQDTFRRDNGKERSCSHLEWDTRQKCARCLKGTQEGCTETCPARRTETPVSEPEQERQTVLA